MVPLRWVPSAVRHPLGGSLGRPGGTQFCVPEFQYQPLGQSATFVATELGSSEDNPKVATANPVAADRAILRFFIYLVLLSLERVSSPRLLSRSNALLQGSLPATVNTSMPPADLSTGWLQVHSVAL
ncbi:hypothetical protein A5764_25115 [Mycobacterium sp. 852002-51057_SCH5723018]|nr:hypothetical protein A5764_25115 [Mycobacterium sp. 852002-51057_SCH5723018]